MADRFVVFVAKPVEEPTGATLDRLGQQLRLSPEKLEALLERLPANVTKPVNESTATAVAERFRRAGLEASVLPAGETGVTAPAAGEPAAPAVTQEPPAPPPTVREPAEPAFRDRGAEQRPHGTGPQERTAGTPDPLLAPQPGVPADDAAAEDVAAADSTPGSRYPEEGRADYAEPTPPSPAVGAPLPPETESFRRETPVTGDTPAGEAPPPARESVRGGVAEERPSAQPEGRAGRGFEGDEEWEAEFGRGTSAPAEEQELFPDRTYHEEPPRRSPSTRTLVALVALVLLAILWFMLR